MSNNVNWNKKLYFQESDYRVSNKKLNQEQNVYRKCVKLHGYYSDDYYFYFRL